jgi:hypothetical protein
MPLEPPENEKRFIDAINQFLVNQRIALLHNQKNMTPTWQDLYKKYLALNLPEQNIETFDVAKKTLEKILTLSQTDTFATYQQAIQTYALEGMPHASQQIYAMPQRLEDIKKAYLRLPDNPCLPDLETLIIEEHRAAKNFNFKNRIQQEIRAWRDPKQAAKLDVKSAMLRTLLNLQAYSPSSQTRINGRTPSDKLRYLDTYLALLLPDIYPEHFEYGTDGELIGRGPHARAITDALGSMPLNPANFNQAALDWLYQADKKNPLWRVLKSMKPITDDFTLADKIQAYQEVSSLLANKKIGAHDEAELGLKLNQTTALLLEDVANTPPREQATIADNLDVMLPNLEQWTAKKKSDETLPQTFGTFIEDTKNKRAASPVLELHQHPTMKTESDTNQIFLNEILTPLQAIQDKTLSAADKSNVLAILHNAERLIQTNPALGPVLYDALKANKKIYQAFASHLDWLQPIKDTQSLEHSSFYARWPKATTENQTILIRLLDKERFDEERLVTDASRMRFRLTPLLEDSKLPSDKRKKIEAYLARCDALVQAYQAIPTYRPKRIESLQEGFILRHTASRFKTFTRLKDELLQDKSLGSECCLTAYGIDEYKTLLTLQNEPHLASLDTRFDTLLADALQRKVENLYKPILDIMKVKKSALPLFPPLSPEEKITILDALERIEQAIHEIPELNIPLNLALTRTDESLKKTLEAYHSARINQQLKKLEEQANQAPLRAYQEAIVNRTFFTCISNQSLSHPEIESTYQRFIQRIEKQAFSPKQKRDLIIQLLHTVTPQYAADIGIQYAASPAPLPHRLNLQRVLNTEDQLLPLLNKLAVLRNKSLTPHEQAQFLRLLSRAREVITQNPSLADVLRDVITERMVLESSYHLQQDKPFQEALQIHLNWLEPIPPPTPIQHSSLYMHLPTSKPVREQKFIDYIEHEYVNEERFVTNISRMRLRLEPLLQDEMLPNKKRNMIENYLQRTAALTKAYQAMLPKPTHMQTTQQAVEAYLIMRNSWAFKAYKTHKDHLRHAEETYPEFHLVQSALNLEKSLIDINNHYVEWNARDENRDFFESTEAYIKDIINPLAERNQFAFTQGDKENYLALIQGAYAVTENNPSFAIALRRIITERLEFERFSILTQDKNFQEQLQTHLEKLKKIEQEPHAKPLILADNAYVVWKKNTPPYPPFGEAFQTCIDNMHAETFERIGAEEASLIIKSSPLNPEEALLQHALILNPDDPDGYLKMQGYIKYIVSKNAIKQPNNLRILEHLINRISPMNPDLSLEQKLTSYQELIRAVSTHALGTKNEKKLITLLSQEAIRLAETQKENTPEINLIFNTIFSIIAPLKLKTLISHVERFIVLRSIKEPTNLQSEDELENDLINTLNEALLDDERFIATVRLEILRLTSSQDNPNLESYHELIQAYEAIPKSRDAITDVQGLTKAYLAKYQSPEFQNFIRLKKAFLTPKTKSFKQHFSGVNTSLILTFSDVKRHYANWAEGQGILQEERLTNQLDDLIQHEYAQERIETGQKKALRIKDNAYFESNAERDKALLRGALSFNPNKEEQVNELHGYINVLKHTLDLTNTQTERLFQLITGMIQAFDDVRYSHRYKFDTYHELLQAITNNALGLDAEEHIKPLIKRALALAAIMLEEAREDDKIYVQDIVIDMELALAPNRPMYHVYRAQIQAFINQYALTEPSPENNPNIMETFTRTVIEPIQHAHGNKVIIAHALEKSELIMKYNPTLRLPLSMAFNRAVDKGIAHLSHPARVTTVEMYRNIIQDKLCFIKLSDPPFTSEENLHTYQTLIHAIEQEPFNTGTKRELVAAIAKQATELMNEEPHLSEDEQAQLNNIRLAIPPIALDAHLDLDRTQEIHEGFLTHVINPLHTFHKKQLSEEQKAAFLALVLDAREHIHENPELGFVLRDVLNERRQLEASYLLQDKAFQKALTQQFNWLKLIDKPAHSSFYTRLPHAASEDELDFMNQIDAELLKQEQVITHALHIKLRLTSRVDDTSLSKNKRAFINTYLERCEELIDAYQDAILLLNTDSIELLGETFRAMQASEKFESYVAIRDEINADQTYYERLGLDTNIPDTSTDLSILQASYAALMPQNIVEGFESLIYDTSQKKAFQTGKQEALRIDQEHHEFKHKQKALLRHALFFKRDTPEAIAKTEGYMSTMATLLGVENTSSNMPLRLVLKNVYATTLHSKLRSYQELIQAIANKELGEGERSELILRLVGDAIQLAENAGENTRAVESIFEDMIPIIKTLNFKKLEGLPERIEQFIQSNQIKHPTRENNEAAIHDFIQTTVTPIALILRAKEQEEEPHRPLSHDEKVIIRQALWKATQFIKHNPTLALPVIIALARGPNSIGQKLRADRSKTINQYLHELEAHAAITTSDTYKMLINNPSSPLVPAKRNPLNLILHALEPTQDARFSLTDQLTLNQQLIESILKSDITPDEKNQLINPLIETSMALAQTYERIHNSKSVEKIFEAIQHLLPERPELQAFIRERAMLQPTVPANLITTDRLINEVINPIALIAARQDWRNTLSTQDETTLCNAIRVARQLCENNPMLAFIIKATFDKNGSPLAKRLMRYRSELVHQELDYFEDHLTHITEQEPGKIVQSNRWLAKHNQEQIKLRKELSPETDAEQIETMKSISKFTRALEEFLSAEQIFAFKQAHAKAILAPLIHDRALKPREKEAIQAYMDTSDTLIGLYQTLGFQEVLEDESQSPEEVARKILEIQQSEAFDVYFFHLTKLVGQYHKLTEIQFRHPDSFNSQAGTFLSQSFQRLMRYNLPMLEMIKDGPPALKGALKASKQVNLNNAMFANGYSGEFQDRAARKPAGPLHRLIALYLNTPEGLEDENYAKLLDRGSERSKRIDGYFKAMLTEAYPEQFQLDATGHLLANPDITEVLGINHGIPGTINPEDFNARALDELYAADKNPLWLVLKSTKPIVADEFSLDDKLQAYQDILRLANNNELGKPKPKGLEAKLKTAIATLESKREEITTRYRGELRELQNMRGEDNKAQQDASRQHGTPKNQH